MSRILFLTTLLLTTSTLLADSPHPTVLLLPFTQIDNSTGARWVGEAVQRSLESDLSHDANTHLQLVTQNVQGLVTDDPAAVVRMAHDAAADYVVAGHYQMVEEQIRLTGNVFDGHTGKPITALKATGPFRTLFELQDSLADQIHLGLRAASTAKAPPVTTPAPVVESSGPLRLTIHRPGPIGTAEEVRYTNRSFHTGHDRYIYSVPGWYGCYGYGGYGCYGYGFPGYGCSGGFGGCNIGFATGGTQTLAW